MTAAPELQNIEIPRDGYGRPLVMPVRGTKRVPYRRTTTFAGVLEDTNGLIKWESRLVAYGMGQRKDLVLAASAADPADKAKLSEIAGKAKEHAGGSAAATTGTALHELTERIDRGHPLGAIPQEHKADIDAYRRATAGMEYTALETFRVYDDWRVAGTADRIGRLNGGRLMIMDLKTGSIDYPHKMAMQLAMYAHSVPYDIGTDTRGTDPDQIDYRRGLIIHLPAGQGVCDLYEIDLTAGWAACVLAKQVWDWRGRKGLLERVDPARVSPGPPTWETLIRDARDVADLRLIWKRANEIGELTPTLRALCTQRSTELSCCDN